MGGVLTRLIVTYAYSCFSASSTAIRMAASTPAECSPTASLILLYREAHGFGGTLDARLLSTRSRSTSELLRTL